MGTALAAATDAEIIRAAWQDPDLFATVYDRYATLLHGYACARIGQRQAEDVVADTFLAAFTQRKDYDLERESARAWLFGILTNKIAQRRRSENIRLRAY